MRRTRHKTHDEAKVDQVSEMDQPTARLRTIEVVRRLAAGDAQAAQVLLADASASQVASEALTLAAFMAQLVPDAAALLDQAHEMQTRVVAGVPLP